MDRKTMNAYLQRVRTARTAELIRDLPGVVLDIAWEWAQDETNDAIGEYIADKFYEALDEAAEYELGLYDEAQEMKAEMRREAHDASE